MVLSITDKKVINKRQFQKCSNVYVKETTDHTDYTDFSQIALPPRPTKTLKILIIKRI